MTSKEALAKLNIECIRSNGADDEYSEELNIIKKDLEVLDIIKRSIYSRETHKYVLNEKLKGQKFMNISLYISGDNDVDKIKEWLDDENNK